jgi:hypothetical protein
MRSGAKSLRKGRLLIITLQALSSTTLGLFLKVIGLGLGKHAEAFPLENIFPFFKVMYFYSIFIIAAYSFIKLSIGFFLLRLADRTKWRPFLIGMLGKLTCLNFEGQATDKQIVFIGVFTIGSTFAIIFQCIPVQAGWDYTLRPPTGYAFHLRPISSTIYTNTIAELQNATTLISLRTLVSSTRPSTSPPICFSL